MRTKDLLLDYKQPLAATQGYSRDVRLDGIDRRAVVPHKKAVGNPGAVLKDANWIGLGPYERALLVGAKFTP